MSYIDDSLGQNETVLYRAHFPGFYHAGAWGLLIAFVVSGLLAYASGFGWLAAMLVLVGLVLFLAIMVPIWTTEIGVTTQRFVFKRGLLWRTTHELQLRAIEEVNLEQSLFGRMLDFGRVELRVAPESTISACRRWPTHSVFAKLCRTAWQSPLSLA